MKKDPIATAIVALLLTSCASSVENVPTKQATNVSVTSTVAAPDPTKFNHAVALLNGYSGDTSTLESARAELESILKVNLRYAPAHREMARYFIKRGHISYQHFQSGSLEAAESSLKKAIEINPNYAEAFVLFGHLYRLMNRPQDALAALEKAEKLGTVDPWLQNNWADLLIDDAKYEEAAGRYRKVIDSKTPDKNAMGAAFQGLISYYSSVGKLDQADEVYKKQLELDPGVAWSYGNYAHFLLCQRGDYDASISRSREALKIMDYGIGRYWLAAALYRKWAQSVLAGNAEAGKPYFTEAQTLYPDPRQIVIRDLSNCPPLMRISDAWMRPHGMVLR